jgi:hypothetical protein
MVQMCVKLCGHPNAVNYAIANISSSANSQQCLCANIGDFQKHRHLGMPCNNVCISTQVKFETVSNSPFYARKVWSPWDHGLRAGLANSGKHIYDIAIGPTEILKAHACNHDMTRAHEIMFTAAVCNPHRV